MLNSVKIKQTGKNILRPHQIQWQYSYFSKGGFRHCLKTPQAGGVYKCIRAHTRLRLDMLGCSLSKGGSKKEVHTLSEAIRTHEPSRLPSPREQVCKKVTCVYRLDQVLEQDKLLCRLHSSC